MKEYNSNKRSQTERMRTTACNPAPAGRFPGKAFTITFDAGGKMERW